MTEAGPDSPAPEPTPPAAASLHCALLGGVGPNSPGKYKTRTLAWEKWDQELILA